MAQSNQADTLTIVSGLGAVVSITSIQPIVTLLASLVAMCHFIYL
jgi:hypothetical protein